VEVDGARTGSTREVWQGGSSQSSARRSAVAPHGVSPPVRVCVCPGVSKEQFHPLVGVVSSLAPPIPCRNRDCICVEGLLCALRTNEKAVGSCSHRIEEQRVVGQPVAFRLDLIQRHQFE
jgi:hypothetical protein